MRARLVQHYDSTELNVPLGQVKPIATKSWSTPVPVTRKRRWAVSLAAAFGLGLVAIVVLLTLPETTPERDWTSLPDPAIGAAGPAVGQFLGAGGGQGPGTVAVQHGPSGGDTAVHITCRGNGALAIADSEHTPVGGVDCYEGSAAQYTLTIPGLSHPSGSFTVTGPETILWRISIAAL